VVTPRWVFWKLMMISRAIGYQEKNAKHNTAPMRNPCAERLRLSCRLRPLRAAHRSSGPGLPLVLLSVTAMSVIDFSGSSLDEASQLRRDDSAGM
jgi:hypothetical protein